MKIKKIKPMFNSIVTTMDKYIDDVKVNGIIDSSKSKGTIKEYQKVLAIGSFVKDIQVGDIICINPRRFAIKKHKDGSLKDGIITDNPVIEYHFDTLNIDDSDCLLLLDCDVSFIIEDYIEDTQSNIIQPEHKVFI